MQSMITDIQTRWPKSKGNVTPESMRERYAHVYSATRNEGFFAKKVILVEGQTESYCIPIYARAMGHDLDILGIAVIECQGKGPIDRLYRIFNELGIACYVVFDYDKSNPDKEIVNTSKALLKMLEHAEDPPAAAVIQDRFSCFAETWEKDLDGEFSDLQEMKRDAKTHIGTESKPLFARFIAASVTKRETPFVPQALRDIISRAIHAKRFGSCLK